MDENAKKVLAFFVVMAGGFGAFSIILALLNSTSDFGVFLGIILVLGVLAGVVGHGSVIINRVLDYLNNK